MRRSPLCRLPQAVAFSLLLFFACHLDAFAQGIGPLQVTVSPHDAVICVDAAQTFTATYQPNSFCSGSPSYQWSVDGLILAGATSNTYTAQWSSAGTHTVSCTVTISSCQGSDTANVTVNTCSSGGCSITSCSITADPSSSCANQPVTFTAHAFD